MEGKIYIASMNMRGKWAEPINNDSIKINVTSSQKKTSKNRLDFSPMTKIVNGYKGYWNFESYWQSGKVFEDIPHDETKKWWQNLNEAKRRYARWSSSPRHSPSPSRISPVAQDQKSTLVCQACL
jgi:hypothetical protein